MTLLRAAYRTMLASYFISSGVRAVRDPAPLAPLAEPLAEKVVPVVKKYAPDEVAHYVPEDPQTLVRLNGALQIVGGLALATGRGRRVGALLLAGSLVPSTLAKYPFWSQTGEQKALSRSHFAKNVSLLGGVLLASRDTEGKPGIAWRAQAGGHAIARSTSRATKKITHSGAGDKLARRASDAGDAISDVADKTSDLAGAAVAGGAALLSAAEIATRGTRKRARKQFAVAQKAAVKQAKETRGTLAKQAKVTGKSLAKQAKEAQKVAAERAAEAKKIAAAKAEEARTAAEKGAKQAAKDAKKQGRKTGKRAQKSAKKVGKHIELGEN